MSQARESSNTCYVVLPGMNGGEELLLPFVDALSEHGRVSVIPLPQSGPQDYPGLTRYVRQRLPRERFVLVAESFSGPIAATIAVDPPSTLAGVVFVATFLSPTNRLALLAARNLPLKRLLGLPPARLLLKYLFVGATAPDALVQDVLDVVREVPTITLQRRIATLRKLDFDGGTSMVPAFYMQPDADRLVPQNKIDDFNRHFDRIECIHVTGPHALLQRYPELSAERIASLVISL